MATLSCSAPIDPARSGKYAILISEQMLRDGTPRKRQRIGVQYNHKPTSLNAQPATIKPAGNGQDDCFTLSIKSEHGAGGYKYEGSQRPSASLALIYDAEKNAFVLDKIDADFSFNLQSTPSDKDAASLATKYPQLVTGAARDDVDGSLNDDQRAEDPDSIPADPNNPYDYRHFLRRDASPSPKPSLQSSPVPNHVFNSSPMLQPSTSFHRPRSSTETKKPPKLRQRYLSPNPQEETHADNEERDRNELVIDMGDSAPLKSKPWRSALSGLNEGRSGRPMSFRSAASSMSPSIRGESDDEKDHKANNDVEEIDLGEPQIERASRDADTPVNGNGWDDEDGDILEAELEQAMEQEAESEQRDQQSQYPSAPARPAESSSESEEE